jgi:hypothetical protein
MRLRGLAAGLGLLVALAAPAAAQVERIDMEGAVAVSRSEEGNAALRRAALANAVDRAVEHVALEFLEASSRTSEPPDADGLMALLGPDRGKYTARAQIARVEGVRAPVLLRADSRAEAEFAVLAQVWVDRDAVRDRLRATGILGSGRAPSGGSDAGALLVILDPPTSFAGYRLLRDELGAVPVELSSERVVLSVSGNGDARGLLRRLRQAAPDGVLVEGSERGGVLHLQVSGEPAAEAAAELTP